MALKFNPFTSNFDLVSSGNIPAGGVAGEVLTKASSSDYDLEWSPVDIVTYTNAAANGLTATAGLYVGVVIDNFGNVVFR